jgi:hypothetical protein
MTSIRNKLRIILTVIASINLFSCSTIGDKVNSYCTFYEPVFNYNSSCSIEVIDAINQNNAIYHELCIKN